MTSVQHRRNPDYQRHHRRFDPNQHGNRFDRNNDRLPNDGPHRVRPDEDPNRVRRGRGPGEVEGQPPEQQQLLQEIKDMLQQLLTAMQQGAGAGGAGAPEPSGGGGGCQGGGGAGAGQMSPEALEQLMAKLREAMSGGDEGAMLAQLLSQFPPEMRQAVIQFLKSLAGASRGAGGAGVGAISGGGGGFGR
jgi:hypothetical protein